MFVLLSLSLWRESKLKTIAVTDIPCLIFYSLIFHFMVMFHISAHKNFSMKRLKFSDANEHIWKIIYLNCWERSKFMTDRLSQLPDGSLCEFVIYPYNIPYMKDHVWSFIYSFASFTFYGYITNSQSDQRPDGLIAQSVEHCNGIAEIRGSNPVQAWIFFELKFHNCLSCVRNCDDQS